MADWEAALAEHEVYTASFDATFWRQYFVDHPDVLYHILADLHQVAGPVRDRAPSLDDLWQLVAPKYSHKPFSEAFTDALGQRSIRQIAAAVSLSHPQVLRYVNGERPIVKVHDPAGSMRRIELFAKALGVRPAYFAEWRRLWVLSLIDVALGLAPNVSIGIYRKFSGQETRSSQSTPREGSVDAGR